MRTPLCLWFPRQGRVPHISLVFREMWDTTAPSPLLSIHPIHLTINIGGIPHLAKNERDVGHPALAMESGHSNRAVLTQTLASASERSLKLSPVGIRRLTQKPSHIKGPIEEDYTVPPGGPAAIDGCPMFAPAYQSLTIINKQ